MSHVLILFGMIVLAIGSVLLFGLSFYLFSFSIKRVEDPVDWLLRIALGIITFITGFALSGVVINFFW